MPHMLEKKEVKSLLVVGNLWLKNNNESEMTFRAGCDRAIEMKCHDRAIYVTHYVNHI